MGHAQVALTSQVPTQFVYVAVDSIYGVICRITGRVAGRAHALDVVINPIGNISPMPILNCLVRVVVDSAAVVNQNRRGACEYIVRVLRDPSPPAFSQVKRYSAVR
ncbi:hypothetical protein [Streptomyces mirabilis]|uniref:hypothetical protein n=1 Tax=Streptomyces mirabilis TaxID=68239 RepID=UPI00225287A7|nr:hypothetical protein [Streptomyces mirabilis]MCX4425857.1 hypothetical protein [Streptomyces mirabilis]